MQARESLLRVARNAEVIETLVIPVNPVPASRPRVTRWGVYYGKLYTAWRDLAKEHLADGGINWEGPVMVVMEHVVKRPKTTKLDYPMPDVDNYAKATLDAITRKGGYWMDDKQVVYLIASKRWTFNDEDPHTLVEIYELP